MRDIRFRAWDTAYKRWVTNANEETRTYVDYGTGYLVRYNTYELMQFTGLLDKNKQPIYEGDIVAIEWSEDSDYRDGYWKRNYVIVGVPGGYEVQNIEDYDSKIMTFSRLDIYIGYEYSYEVVGNIHEHPELLDKKDL